MSAKLDNAQKKDTDETKTSQTGETIVQIPLDELFPLRGHPFSVNDDDLMEQTVASKVFKHDDIVREGTQSDMDFGDWLLNENKITQSEYDKTVSVATEIISQCKK